MPDVSDDTVSAFHTAVSQLDAFARSTHLLGPNFGVAMAVLLHRTDPDRFVIPLTGSATTTGDLQTEVCDPTWEKSREFLPAGATGPIHKPFTTSFKGKSPQVNNWRNSFDIQAGLGCSAPFTPVHLQSAGFVAEHRFDCSFRGQESGYCHAAGTGALCFNPTKRGNGLPAWSDTSARHRPKLLRRGTDAEGITGYWSIEPTVDSLSDLLGSPDARVPADAFATVLFGGSPYWSQWSNDHSASRLQATLALDDEQFFTLFRTTTAITSSAESPVEATATSSQRGERGDQPASTGAADRHVPLPRASSTLVPTDYVDQNADIVIALAGHESDPERRRRLLENATQGHRRILNALAARLKKRGFAVKEQVGGYDLHAFDGVDRHLLFEAKTWTAANLASQVRSGWAQLEEYAYRSRTTVGESPELVLALNHEPPVDFWAWEWFSARHAPFVIWLTEDDIDTFEHHREWLNGLLSEAPPSAPSTH